MGSSFNVEKQICAGSYVLKRSAEIEEIQRHNHRTRENSLVLCSEIIINRKVPECVETLHASHTETGGAVPLSYTIPFHAQYSNISIYI